MKEEEHHPLYPNYSLNYLEEPTVKDIIQAYKDWILGQGPYKPNQKENPRRGSHILRLIRIFKD